MSTIKNNDLFITERSTSNYRVTAEDLKTFVGVFNAGTKLLFNNPSAPLGWVNLANASTNLSTLRIVKTGGGGTGGSGSFNTAYGNHSIKASKHKHAVSETDHTHAASLASHTHGVNDPGHAHNLVTTRSVQQQTTDDRAFSLSSTEGGEPVSYTPSFFAIDSAITNISINADSSSSTSGNNTALNISVNNTGTAVNWNFNIRYNDFIICQKSP